MHNNDALFVEALIQIATQYKLKRLRVREFEIEMFEAPSTPKQVTPEDELMPKTVDLKDGMPADDEMLMYSTENFDLMRAEREEQQ